ncbi:class I SAM-dependent methyltransferase [Halobacterium sp. R2-5]|uniref:class I SAM-dependent methyltransferase n=1 Tax=Halobacterium sp. R2-5 TaxID=2715751 RepID=UPI001424923D|nr:class I SAM-dependent methyltransferase [Halobacterium sp. R2-5]NIB99053.1 class I SAM-dependent methyltransferase [Halobacterium sp. R2-5]
MDAWQDDDALADQYADASNLAARQVLHARFSTAEKSVHEWLFDQFDLPENATVLSLGAGHGALWTANADRIPAGWDVTVTDNYPGMVMDAMEALEDVDREFDFDAVDAREIPYPEDTFDAVTAHFVLSHLTDADREQALREIRRVLKADGTLYAAANGEADLREVFDVAESYGTLPDASGFTLENGAAQLREAFSDVERRDVEHTLRITKPEPVVAYLLSLPGFEGADAFALEDAFRERTGDDAFEVDRVAGAFVASASE